MQGYQDIEDLALYQEDLDKQKTAERRRDAVLQAILCLLIIGVIVFVITEIAKGHFKFETNNDEPEKDLLDASTNNTPSQSV